MRLVHIHRRIVMAGALGCLMAISAAALSACAPTQMARAGHEPAYCGGDFGMMQQMEDEIQGTPTYLTAQDYARC